MGNLITRPPTGPIYQTEQQLHTSISEHKQHVNTVQIIAQQILDKTTPGMYENYGVYSDIIRDAKNLLDPEFKDNWASIIQYNTFRLTGNYNSVPMNIANYKPILTLYKLARVMFDHKLNTDVAALLTLQMNADSRIAIGSTGQQLLNSSEMKGGEKYCVDDCYIAGVQFIGPFAKVQEVMLNFNRVDIISNFDPNFKYVIGEHIQEKDFGKPGRGCICGIHVFVSKQAAIKYLNTGFTGIDLFSPYIGIPITGYETETKIGTEINDQFNMAGIDVDLIMEQYHKYNNALKVNQAQLGRTTSKLFGSWYG